MKKKDFLVIPLKEHSKQNFFPEWCSVLVHTALLREFNKVFVYVIEISRLSSILKFTFLYM